MIRLTMTEAYVTAAITSKSSKFEHEPGMYHSICSSFLILLVISLVVISTVEFEMKERLTSLIAGLEELELQL